MMPSISRKGQQGQARTTTSFFISTRMTTDRQREDVMEHN
jgi:hypothetical protein